MKATTKTDYTKKTARRPAQPKKGKKRKDPQAVNRASNAALLEKMKANDLAHDRELARIKADLSAEIAVLSRALTETCRKTPHDKQWYIEKAIDDISEELKQK